MGHHEAVEDGIRSIGDIYTNNQYVIPCYECGSDVISWSYIRGRKYTCKICKEMKKEIRKPIQLENKKRKLQNAINRIKQQGNNIDLYSNAINEIERLLENSNWFQSTEEIMVALQLYKRKIPFNHQVKIHSYIVDFVLPKDNIVLEVDGELFHTDKTKDREQVRDEFIRNFMGNQWEVIRVTDAHINENIKKLPLAIKTIYKNRQRQRSMRNGNLTKGWARVI